MCNNKDVTTGVPDQPNHCSIIKIRQMPTEQTKQEDRTGKSLSFSNKIKGISNL